MATRDQLIRRTVYWNESAEGWYDAETNVHVPNMPPPAVNNSKLREFAEQQGIPIDRWAPVQLEHHPSDKSFSVTYEQAQEVIQEALEQRSAKTRMYFAQGPDQLVTVAYLRETIGDLRGDLVSEVIDLWNKEAEDRRRLYDLYIQLSRPWWKRWFRR